MNISPDQKILWQWDFVVINSTIVTTWALMLVMTVGAKLITRKLKTEGAISRWQGFLEIVVTTIQKQIQEVGLQNPAKYLGFIGTLFLFIAVSNLCAIIPCYDPPTGSLSTTSALAISVFVAVVLFGIEEQGFLGLPQNLCEADVHHAAVQHHRRAVAHVCPGHPSVRQHHERDDDCRHLADDHALHLPGSS